MTSKQRAAMKKHAQLLKPKLIIGAASVHENTIESINQIFNNVEVIKVKVNRADKTDKKETRRVADELAVMVKGVEVVDIIGTTIILYRAHKDKDQRWEW